MKINCLFWLILLLPFALFSQVGIGTQTLNNGVMLQIDSDNKGILIPRIALTNAMDSSTIPGTLTNGTLIYNTTDNASLNEGFYYWKTEKWIAITPEATTNVYNSDGVLNSDRVISAGDKTLSLEGNTGRNALTISRNDDNINQGLAFRNSGSFYDASIYMDKVATSPGGLVLATGKNRPNIEDVLPTMTLNRDRSIRFNDYGGGTKNGANAYLLGVDASGKVVEEPTSDYTKNIYTADGTLTGDRIINTNDHSITFRNSDDRDFSIIPADPSDGDLPFIFKTENAFTFQVDGYDALAIDSNSHIRFGRYGDVTQQIGGTAVFQLGVDATGQVIEVDLPQTNNGMQYYSYNLPDITDPPDISTIRTIRTANKTGTYSGLLDSDSGALTIMKPSQDNYAIKVTGYYFVQNAGAFNFISGSDDGARIYIDGSLILNAWSIGNPAGNGSVKLGRGKHKFEFWYFQEQGSSGLQFIWNTNQDSRSGVINASQFTID